MLRYLTIVIVAILLSTAIASPKRKSRSQKELYDCVFTALKDAEELRGIKYMNYTPNEPKDVNCDELIEEFASGLNLATQKEVETDREFSSYSECIMEKYMKFSTAVNRMENYIYKEDKTMTALRKRKVIIETSAVVENKMELAQELCAPEKVFGDFFDDTYGEDSDNTTETDTNEEKPEEDPLEDLQEDYCQRDYLVKQKIIDTKVYNVVVNPKNISVDNINCNKIWDSSSQEWVIDLKDQFVVGFSETDKKTKRCIKNTIQNGKYAENILKIWVLSELKVSKEQRIAERAAFINFMTNLYANVMKCDTST